jgi:hypothetical protein
VLWLGIGPLFPLLLVGPLVAAGSGHVVALPCPCLNAYDELQVVWRIQIVLTCGSISSMWLAEFKLSL